jgi:hypothetical protein
VKQQILHFRSVGDPGCFACGLGKCHPQPLSTCNLLSIAQGTSKALHNAVRNTQQSDGRVSSQV